MIDMHSHVLFGVDDGPPTIEETMALIGRAEKEGITDLICTPHAFHPQFHVESSEINSQIALLSDVIAASGCNVHLHSGMEVRIKENLLDKLDEKEILTLCGSRYLLVELPSQHIPPYFVRMIQAFTAKGIIPVIAHPERNRAIAQKPHLLEQLVRNGAVAQITAGSISGCYGRNIQKLSIKLIQSNLIHLYGSDVHNMSTRPFHFEKGLNVLKKRGLQDIVELLLVNNRRVLDDEPLYMLEPEIPRPRKWLGII